MLCLMSDQMTNSLSLDGLGIITVSRSISVTQSVGHLLNTYSQWFKCSESVLHSQWVIVTQSVCVGINMQTSVNIDNNNSSVRL